LLRSANERSLKRKKKALRRPFGPQVLSGPGELGISIPEGRLFGTGLTSCRQGGERTRGRIGKSPHTRRDFPRYGRLKKARIPHPPKKKTMPPQTKNPPTHPGPAPPPTRKDHHTLLLRVEKPPARGANTAGKAKPPPDDTSAHETGQPASVGDNSTTLVPE